LAGNCRYFERSSNDRSKSLGVLNLAAEFGNVSRACKVMGFSRDTFYRYQSAIEEYGVEALIELYLET